MVFRLGFRESEGMNSRHAAWLASHEAVNSDNFPISLPTPADIARRAHARMFRTASYIAKRAADAGATQSMAVTITLPSRFHPSTTAEGSRIPNPRYDGSTPRDGKIFFDKRWSLFDNQCRRLGVKRDYIIAAEPHKDERRTGTAFFGRITRKNLNACSCSISIIQQNQEMAQQTCACACIY